ncbi:hypothetical protein Vafri_14128 [Volvox africanus]|uniref:Uncharacterized protein n=1 Tax=Volvox africanus TaxID=51714 RepID=A0A8J4F483_9CHLO|nr:hypothetical protein Vafri_14128 [Volvox africanus]
MSMCTVRAVLRGLKSKWHGKEIYYQATLMGQEVPYFIIFWTEHHPGPWTPAETEYMGLAVVYVDRPRLQCGLPYRQDKCKRGGRSRPLHQHATGRCAAKERAFVKEAPI